jgi:hypothetical protein
MRSRRKRRGSALPRLREYWRRARPGGYRAACRHDAPSCSFSAAGVTSNLRLPQTLTGGRRAAADARRRPPSARRRRSATPAPVRSGLQRRIAPLRARRQAGVDQCHRQTPSAGRVDQVWPQLGFHQEPDLRPEVIEKTPSGIRQVVGQVSLRQPFRDAASNSRPVARPVGVMCVSSRACVRIALEQRGDQRLGGTRFADRNRVQPDQRPRARARRSRAARPVAAGTPAAGVPATTAATRPAAWPGRRAASRRPDAPSAQRLLGDPQHLGDRRRCTGRRDCARSRCRRRRSAPGRSRRRGR